MRNTILGLGVASAVLVAGCATDDPNRRAKTGAAIGALVGAVAGHQVDGDKGRYIGAAVGALAGGAVGHYQDKQAAELERELAAEQARGELNITRLSGNALKVGIASDATFDFDSAAIKSSAQATYAKIASVLKDYDKTIIHVVGHTDSTGSDSYNQGLSERRASAVASALTSNGLNTARLLTEGRGEAEPIADNGSKDGQRRNRRVDIVIKPIVEGQEQQAYTPPPYLGA
ncbi:OmpA family protein [uncultured Abyssibacter sp.]|uniref:OmpA family protein n=1 Tax=uncultured Abyssibacter sp. TaxID=2320202 RepID=UPI0032B1836A